MNRENFKKGLRHLINCESMENGSNTPDFMLADYLMDCLESYEKVTKAREKYYGRSATVNATPNKCDRTDDQI